MAITFPTQPKRPPHEKRKAYEIRVTAFLDLMGFAAYVGRSSRSRKLVDQLYRDLDIVSKSVSEGRRYGWSGWTRRSTTFSDSIVISEHLPACDIFDFLCNIGLLQRQLMHLELPVRGGITIGKLFHSEDKVFGPALVDAYVIESSIAKYPRVIIHRQMVAGIKENDRAREIIKMDDDGIYFIDFLSERVGKHWALDINMLEVAYETIEKMLNFFQSDVKVMDKLLWVDRYYRDHLSEHYLEFRRNNPLTSTPRTVGR